MAEISDNSLAQLSADERSELIRRLQGLTAQDYHPSREVVLVRRWFLRFLAACCVLLVPWIVALAQQLPRHYVAGHWRLTWIGFDLALFASLAWAAWNLWRQRPIAISATFVAATLLFCDAWFDVTTSAPGRDLVVSLLTALAIEIPLACSLLLVSGRVRRITVDLSRGIVPSMRKK